MRGERSEGAIRANGAECFNLRFHGYSAGYRKRMSGTVDPVPWVAELPRGQLHRTAAAKSA